LDGILVQHLGALDRLAPDLGDHLNVDRRAS
jgi:hypothetical protein